MLETKCLGDKCKMLVTDSASHQHPQIVNDFESPILMFEYYCSNGTKKGQKVKMHATHARNADECAEKDGEWLEFYDYLDIVERRVSEINIRKKLYSNVGR